ncbi:MAG: alpha/beta hydrolase [Methylibium sp. NZG]|nr:MAG: alpha/beta hydrolase [Methylibium sp. NZG]
MPGPARVERPHLVLLPGLVCDAAVWHPQVEALCDIANCHVIDYGTRDSLRAMAEHVLATAPAPRFALAGHSMGGRVAFEVMRLAPERVTHLALLDTSYHPLPEGEAGAAEKAGRLALLATARAHGMRAMGRAWAVPMVHPDRVGTPVFDAVLDMIERCTPAHFEAQIHALLNRPDAAPMLATIACPTLLLCGREDGWSPPWRHEFMRDAIAGSTLVVVERCGHMCTMEQPEAVAGAMRAWLAARR